jgi:hypothetical protein
LNKSPSGSICPYYYMGGELHPLKYGSYFCDKEKLFAVIKSSGHNNRRIWIDLYETKLDNEVIDTLSLHIKTVRPKIFKLCFVGCSIFDRTRLKLKMAEKRIDIVEQIKFFQIQKRQNNGWSLKESDVNIVHFRTSQFVYITNYW